ncbi:hypothetical protein LN650_00020 [Klebsiella pneumoniae subsp. pneumoniae]|nr:hypothetical protein [Klebsiella pneumoniae subsp. pneumoniae]
MLVIQMFMLLSERALISHHYTKLTRHRFPKMRSFVPGMIAIVAVDGVAWMAETMFGRT